MIRTRRIFFSILALLLPAQIVGSTAEEAKATRHVVLIIWDGMRPDFVSEENTPVLWNLAKEGVVFRRHHAVYPSSTEVNGVAMATGGYPGRSGIVANREYWPDIDNRKPIDTQSPRAVRKGDHLSGGKYLAFPTITEYVRAAGGRAVVAAAKDVRLLQDRHPPEAYGITLSTGDAYPHARLAPIVARLGQFPRAKSVPDARRDAWTTAALTDFLWKDKIPTFSMLWLSEPDASEHRFAPGSREAATAMKSSDDNLARVLAALDQQGVRAATDIFVASDHGLSTIERSIDLPGIAAGSIGRQNLVRSNDASRWPVGKTRDTNYQGSAQIPFGNMAAESANFARGIDHIPGSRPRRLYAQGNCTRQKLRENFAATVSRESGWNGRFLFSMTRKNGQNFLKEPLDAASGF